MEAPPESFLKLVADIRDAETLARLHDSFTPDQVIENCLAALECMPDDWFSASMLIYELAAGFHGKEHARVYWPIVKRSPLKEMAKHWVVKCPGSRRNAVFHLVSKFCDRQFLPVLNLGFRTWKDSDPVAMPPLLSELAWLHDPFLGKKIQYLARHECFLNRLAVLDYFDVVRFVPESVDLELEKTLANDPHPLVRSWAVGKSRASLFMISNLYKNLMAEKGCFHEPDAAEIAEFANSNLENLLDPGSNYWNRQWDLPSEGHRQPNANGPSRK